jgi:hypothetical protein
MLYSLFSSQALLEVGSLKYNVRLCIDQGSAEADVPLVSFEANFHTVEYEDLCYTYKLQDYDDFVFATLYVAFISTMIVCSSRSRSNNRMIIVINLSLSCQAQSHQGNVVPGYCSN